jgi:hypothetical protein
MAERQSRDAQVFTMHLNTRFSAHLMLRIRPRGSMQQCKQWVHEPLRAVGEGQVDILLS